ncbi:MAG: Xaa-Pro peptidase family protein [Actinobacteria bacterium]|nr:Xaa-Pro peptidase family protein [Actinomycetota bacterium]
MADSARLHRAREVLGELGFGALLVGPGADLRYLTGYNALAMERLTLLVVPQADDASLLVPELEAPRAASSGATELVELRTWKEHEDPIANVRDVLAGAGVEREATLAVQDQLWSSFLLRLQMALPEASWTEGGEVTTRLRIVKTEEELELLRAAAQAIDRVHAQVGALLTPGRTEDEVGRDIAELILEDHDEVAFIIVASGPNGASPHHETGGRTLASGDTVVVDIGGVRQGYCSDSTRNYAIGPVSAEYLEAHEVLRRAQEAGVTAARSGAAAEDVDRACRDIITEAGYGERFVHRTGHGIGVEVHEQPYLVEGNEVTLETGMTFSVEPGIYLPGRFGMRIEDIVTATPQGGERLNTRSHELVEVSA